MGNLCPNLVLYPKFKCVWLTFYLFLVFSWADLSSLSLCHGVPWPKVAQWDPGTMWQRNSYELSMNCFIHQVHALALPLYAIKPAIKNWKMSVHTQVLPIFIHWGQTLWWAPIFAFPPIIFLLDGLNCNSDCWPWERQLIEWGSGCLSYAAN